MNQAPLPVPTVEVHYFTVGIRYAQEEHPTLGRIAHPEGWIEVHGVDDEAARALVIALCGSAWAFQYTAETFNKRFHAHGRPFLTIGVTPALTEVGPVNQ